MKRPSVLVVGAGAVGLVTGYHLGLGGSEITYLVRPARCEALRSPQKLYCYDDGQIKTYADYAVISTIAEIAGRHFDFVLFTPDATSCRSAEGTQMLGELADAIRSISTVLIMVAVGIGLREHVLTATGLPDDRLLEGTLGNAAHQVSANLPQHSPTDPKVVATASIAYRHFPNRVGFMLVPVPRAAARQFAAIYDRCGVSRCTLINAVIYRIYTNVFFCYTVTADLLDWPSAANLRKQRTMLQLCVRAAREVLGLTQFGWIGRLLGLLLNENNLIRMIDKYERDLRPLDFAAFNRFHHGEKVMAQDVEVLRNCLNEGRAQGRPMASIEELLQRFDNHYVLSGGNKT